MFLLSLKLDLKVLIRMKVALSYVVSLFRNHQKINDQIGQGNVKPVRSYKSAKKKLLDI